jgi:hypothetical protein
MPITFRDREQAFEAKFAHDEELRFIALARRDKMFARRIADRLSLTTAVTEHLTGEVLAVRNGPGHDRAVLDRVAAFLSTHGFTVPEAELQDALDGCLRQAMRDLSQASGPIEG